MKMKQKKEIIKIRGHHLNLFYELINFNGNKKEYIQLWKPFLHAYSLEFLENLFILLNKLKRNQADIAVVSEFDSLCAFCEAKRIADCFDSPEYDRICTEQFGLGVGMIYNGQEFVSQLKAISVSVI